MSDQPLVLAVATYSSKESAQQDFKAIWSEKKTRDPDHLDAAVVVKTADGLAIDRHDTTTRKLAWGGALIGGAFAVLVPPLGAALLAGGALAGAGGLIGHFWKNIPKAELRRMSDLLEAGEAALVIVAVDLTSNEIRPAFAGAVETILVDTNYAGLDDAFDKALTEAKTDEAHKQQKGDG